MSEPKKTLVNEVLPAPTPNASGRARERVVRHVKQVMKYGATAGAGAIASCGFMAVDSLPPPASCATMDPATPEVEALIASTGRLQVKLAYRPEFRDFSGGWGATFHWSEPVDVTGATLFSANEIDTSAPPTDFILLVPTAATTVSFRTTFSCISDDGATAEETILVTIVLDDAPADGGTARSVVTATAVLETRDR